MASHFPTFRRWLNVFGLGRSIPPHPMDAPASRSFWPLRTKRPQRQALLRLIATGAETNVPLAPLLNAWAADERGTQRTRVYHLARLLAQGIPLPEAAEQAAGALKAEDILAIRFGHQSGALAATLRDAADSLEPAATIETTSFRTTATQFAIMGFIAFMIVAFVLIKIVPAYQAIYEDFDLMLPWQTIVFINFANGFARYWYVFVFAIVLLAFGALSFQRNGVVRALVNRLSGGVRQLYAADVLRKLSIAARTGRPLAGALSTLARYHFDATVRRKLLFVRNEVEHGADPWQIMTSEGLINRNDAAVLATADRLGNRAWALRQLGLAKRSRIERRWNWWSQLALPAMVLAFGLFVLLHAVAMMAPLADLISNLAG